MRTPEENVQNTHKELAREQDMNRVFSVHCVCDKHIGGQEATSHQAAVQPH